MDNNCYSESELRDRCDGEHGVCWREVVCWSVPFLAFVQTVYFRQAFYNLDFSYFQLGSFGPVFFVIYQFTQTSIPVRRVLFLAFYPRYV
jgi:hypothetical protein